jgi:hypothetical protein
MIEKAFVSGQIAQAIFKEDDKLFLIKAKDTENTMECTPYEESLFFNSDTEIKVLGNIAINELRKTLVKEKSNFDALYGAIGGFDRNLSEKTRILSIQRAESLVKNPEIFDFVIFRLFGNPVPKDAALKKAVKLSIQNGFQEMNSIYKKLLNNGYVIESILSIFKDTIWELSLEKEFVMLKNIFITSGIFAKFFLSITTTAKGLVKKIVNEFSDNDHIKKIPGIGTILIFMITKIRRDKFCKKHKEFKERISSQLKDKLRRIDQIERQAAYYVIKKEKTVEYPDAKKGVSFIKIRDPHDENKKGEKDKPTTSKKQK